MSGDKDLSSAVEGGGGSGGVEGDSSASRGKWVISPDGSEFLAEEFETREAAVAEAKKAFGDTVFVAQIEVYEPIVLAGDVIDDVLDFAEGEIDGEDVDKWSAKLNAAKEEQVEDLTAKLTDVLVEWMRRNDLLPHFNVVGDIEKVD